MKTISRHEAFDTATRGPGRPIATSGAKRGGTFTWFVEIGGTKDIIKDAEQIRDELFRLHMGLWGYAKKHNPKANGNLRMVWLNYVPGVRESRRLIGDYMMTQKDYDEDLDHRDLVAFTRWGIDDHHPYGFFTKGIDVIHVYNGKMVGIPYRCLYSKNIGNLFMAGRCLSASHMAAAGHRVMRPMAATGQAVGTAAALATRYKTSPRGVYRQHTSELQQILLRDGCYIPGVGNGDPLDLALTAETRFPTIINGWNNEMKPSGGSVPWKEDEPIELRLQEPATVACVHLSLANRRNKATFAVDALVDGQWKELVRSPGTSKQRRYVYNVGPVKTDRLRFRLIKSSEKVAITEIRVYSQPGHETKLKLPEPVGFPPVITN